MSLRHCAAKLEADADLPEPDEEGSIHPIAEAVLIEIARFAGSLAYDNVNDEWLVPKS